MWSWNEVQNEGGGGATETERVCCAASPLLGRYCMQWHLREQMRRERQQQLTTSTSTIAATASATAAGAPASSAAAAADATAGQVAVQTGMAVEMWSTSENRWTKGAVVATDEDGSLHVQFDHYSQVVPPADAARFVRPVAGIPEAAQQAPAMSQ